MADRFDFIRQEMEALQEAGLAPPLAHDQPPPGAWMTVDGKRVLNLCTNNYLGLANDTRLVQAAHQALDRFGVGPTAVRSIAGTLDHARQLEQRWPPFKGVEDALYVQSGFCANQAAIRPLVGKEDVIFSDRLNHASDH